MSQEFSWTEEYSVEIPEIDEQHKTLFELIESLDQAIGERRGSAVCAQILEQLVEYTKVHFSVEEALMRMGRYPNFEEHCERHRELVAEVEVLQDKVRNGTAAISFELMQFLRTWLTRHILKEDRLYAEHFAGGGFRASRDWSRDAQQASAKQKRKWWKFW